MGERDVGEEDDFFDDRHYSRPDEEAHVDEENSVREDDAAPAPALEVYCATT